MDKMKNVTKIVFLFFVAFSIVKPQQSRLNSLGCVSFSVYDVDSQLDPYNFGGNPAWIVNGQTRQRLEIVPALTSGQGTYHRYFDPDGANNYSASFVGIKPLGKSGTFKGSAYYSYFLRKGNNRALTFNPYSGASYFFTDTTKGNFRYSGPTFEFLHGLRIYKNLYFGAAVDYQILDGLKDIYTYAQTLYRNVSGKIGIAYGFGKNFVVGFHYYLYDLQERIEASDINLLTVRTFLYRGEKYKIELRGSRQNFKVRSDGKAYNAQIFFAPFRGFTVGIKGKYFIHRSRYLFPRSSIIDDEDGYASFAETDILMNARWRYSKRITFGFSGGYYEDNSWTKNSKRDLTTWKWNLKDTHFGLGFSLSPFGKRILIATEFEGHFVSADSTKYIDHRSNSLSAFNGTLRLGVEVPIGKKAVVRVGYNYLHLAHDFLYNFDDATTHLFTGGFKYRISNVFEIEPVVKVAFTSTPQDVHKQEIESFVYLRFFQF